MLVALALSCSPRDNDEGRASAASAGPSDQGVSGGFRQVVAGLRHSCALRPDGRVLCWGANDLHQLGVFSGQRSQIPVPIEGIDDAVSIAAGGDLSCAIRGDASMVCWGALLPGHGSERWESGWPTLLALWPPVAAVAIGPSHVCVALFDGALRCLGTDVNGGFDWKQAAADRHAPLDTPWPVAQLIAGPLWTCVRGGPGQVACNGAALGTSLSRPLPGLEGIADISASADTLSALDADGKVWIHGRYPLSEPPAGCDLDHCALPAVLPGVVDPIRLGVGSAGHTCAVGRDGRVQCWGHNRAGIRGTKDGAGRTLLPALPGVNRAQKVAIGGAHTCALVEGGRVLCWGRSEAARDGKEHGPGRAHGPEGRHVVEVPGIDDAVRVSVSDSHGCATRRGGRVSCWGRNRSGAFGIAWPPIAVAPVESTPLAGWTGLATTRDGTCGIDPHGQARCAGARRYLLGMGQPGVFGHGPLPGLESASRLALGHAIHPGAHCALARDATVRCWGSSLTPIGGSLWPFGHKGVYPPRAVPGLSRVAALDVALSHACAVTRGGGVWCWGSNFNGGLSGNYPDGGPFKVAGIEDAVDVATPFSSCALREGGELWCWGNSACIYPRVRGPRVTAPTRLSALPPASAMSMAGSTACIIARTGQVWCWCDNQFGQLAGGAPTGIRPNPPVAIAGVSQAVNIDTAWNQVCAVRSTGHVACWGETDFGLPDPASPWSDQPVEVQAGEVPGQARNLRAPHAIAGISAPLRRLAMALVRPPVALQPRSPPTVVPAVGVPTVACPTEAVLAAAPPAVALEKGLQSRPENCGGRARRPVPASPSFQ